MSFVRSSFLPTLLALSLSTCSGMLSAAEPDARAQSRALFVEGVAALEAKRPADALAFFERAYALFPHYSTQYNIGLCHRDLGHHAAAAAAFERYLSEGGDEIPADERARVTELLAEEEARTATLTVDVRPRGELTVDGRPETPGKPLRLDPGEHVLEASLAGHTTTRKTVATNAGEQTLVTLQLDPLPEPKAPASPVAHDRSRATLWTALGISGLGLATFGIFGTLALSEHDAYTGAATDALAAEHRTRGRNFGIIADVGLVVGLASAGLAAVLAIGSTKTDHR